MSMETRLTDVRDISVQAYPSASARPPFLASTHLLCCVVLSFHSGVAARDTARATYFQLPLGSASHRPPSRVAILALNRR